MICTQPLVSIIVPVYNVENYIDQCINSIISQTYKNIELIVINDGSTDKSLQRLNRIKKHFKMIILNQNNKGQAYARNKGLEYSSGKYILFVDADDFIDEKTVERTVLLSEANEVDVIRFNAKSFTELSNIKLRYYDFSNTLKENKIYINKELKYIYNSFNPSPCLFLFKKSLLDDNNINFFNGIIHEDELFTTRIFLSAKKFMYINAYLYNRRIRKESTITNNSINQKRFSYYSYFIIIKELEELIKKYSIDKLKSKFIIRWINELFYSRNKITVDKDYKNKYQIKSNFIKKRFQMYIHLKRNAKNIEYSIKKRIY